MTQSRISRISIPLLYLLTGALCILIVQMPYWGAPSDQLFAWLKAWQLGIVGILAGGLIFSVFKRKTSRVWWEALLNVVIPLGLWYALLLLNLPFGGSIILASLLTLVYLLMRNVFVHNIFYVLGSVGVALNFTFLFPVQVLIAGLVAFGLYDIVTGRSAEVIDKLAKKLSPFGFVPGLIIPISIKDLWTEVDSAHRSHALILGLTEIVLPITLIARSAFWGSWQPWVVLAGVLTGSLVLLFKRSGLYGSALAPLSAGALTPFIILYIYHISHIT
ncbi:MAG: hypothetical protein ABII13_02265 [Patescibacteria group bacterium]|nr:hypothetical protein [Patescibacteria group bacterium]